ncbi:MAG: metallophosphoesterase family protein [Luteolibacter sp.]
MKPSVFFTADTHFGHDKIVGLAKRPFDNIKDHDQSLIAWWNKAVHKGDTVYHLGDFAWHSIPAYREQLNGNIHLVLGNHDRLKSADIACFASVSEYKKVKVDTQLIYMMHYAMRVWNRSHYGSWHLYGHSHGTLPDLPYARSLDIGVDVHGYMPVPFERVAQLMARKTWRPVDQHGLPRIVSHV